MPIRDYTCPKCEEIFEVRHHTRAEFEEKKWTTACPECSEIAEPTLNKTAPPMFSGSGFHSTDYKSRK